MKTIPQHTSQTSKSPAPAPSVPSALHFFRRTTKRLTIWAYCRNYLSLDFTERIFGWLDLRDA